MTYTTGFNYILGDNLVLEVNAEVEIDTIEGGLLPDYNIESVVSLSVTLPDGSEFNSDEVFIKDGDFFICLTEILEEEALSQEVYE